jgi:site-specific DNA-cytosine methylase
MPLTHHRMKILVACEYSGTVRDAFIEAGHDAMSCDLLPTERPGPHYQGDVRDILINKWDLMVAHPPCTYLSKAGARWWKDPARQILSAEAAAFVLELWNAPIEKIAIENPRGQLNQRWRTPDQTVQPWWFGDPYSKATCLWLKNLPPLMATAVRGEFTPFIRSNTGGAKRGQKTHQGTAKNWKQASTTFPGVARAMAEQWGSLSKQSAA